MLWGIAYGIVQRMMIDAPSYKSGKAIKETKEKSLDEDGYEALFQKYKTP